LQFGFGPSDAERSEFRDPDAGIFLRRDETTMRPSASKIGWRSLQIQSPQRQSLALNAAMENPGF